jgi:hypothetical protein
MMLNSKAITATVMFFLFFCAVNLSAVETAKKSGKRKILVGAGLMAGGAALSLTSDINFFDKGDNLQFLSGIGIFGVGCVLTIWGLHENSHRNLASTSLKEQAEPRTEMQFIAGPTRKGIGAGMIIKW